MKEKTSGLVGEEGLPIYPGLLRLHNKAKRYHRNSSSMSLYLMLEVSHGYSD